MTLRSLIVLGLMAAGVTVPLLGQQCKSVLANIDCGGNQATCFQEKIGLTGAVRCSCTASCLPAHTPILGATRQVQWGQTYPCRNALTGIAQGGTTVYGNTSIQSSIFAVTYLMGSYAGAPRKSKQQTDCFDGLVGCL
jgi:hypothetical protein